MKKEQRYTVLYERLSHDDELQGESNSISNQKLKAENPYTYWIPAEEYDQEHYSRQSVVLAESVVTDF